MRWALANRLTDEPRQADRLQRLLVDRTPRFTVGLSGLPLPERQNNFPASSIYCRLLCELSSDIELTIVIKFCLLAA